MTSTTPSAATDVEEFMSDLDGGQFARMLSVALSQVSAGVLDAERKVKGKVQITLDITRIPKTGQVCIDHKLSFVRPTMQGKASEEATGQTVMHVGQAGRLTLTQPRLFGEPAERQQSRIE